MSYNNEKILEFIKKSASGVAKFFLGKLLASFIIGVCTYAVMALLKAPVPWLLGLLTGAGNMLPTVGPIISYAICALILVFTQPIQAIWLLIVTVIAQILDGFILTPLITGKSTEIKPLIVIILIMLGGSAFGIPGILLAVPAAIVVKVFYSVFLKEDNSNKYKQL